MSANSNAKSNYYRSLFVLKQERTDYARVGRVSAGRCLFEAREKERRREGRIAVYVQDLKPETQYKLYIISISANGKDSTGVCIGSVFVDAKGKGESNFSFDADDVFQSGLSIEEFCVAAVVAANRPEAEMVAALVGFKDGVHIMWRINLKIFDPSKKVTEPKIEAIPAAKETVEVNELDETEEVAEEKEVVIEDEEETEEAKEVIIEDVVEAGEAVEESEVVIEDVVEAGEAVEESEVVIEDVVEAGEAGEAGEADEVVIEDVVEAGEANEVVIEDVVEAGEANEVVIEDVAEAEEANGVVIGDVEEVERAEETEKIQEVQEIEEKIEIAEVIETEEESDVKVEIEMDAVDTDSEKNKRVMKFIRYEQTEPPEVENMEKRDPHEVFRAMAKKFNEEMEALTNYTFTIGEKTENKQSSGAEVEGMESLEINEQAPVTNGEGEYNDKNDIDLIFETNTKMKPFINQKADVEWVRTSPSELPAFPFEFDKYINEPFVVLAYKNFKHLIMGRAEIEGKTRYILGVPDIFSFDKKNSAAELGFMQFKSCSGELAEGEHGYWLFVI